ncbi:hypothetical protein Fmac_026170 [Flemingia macrophylla]|uniref:Uncharacterized protein n=1 Tax=Flemingia macrophylla TaxID=520843 RepID=A0ABD1LE36_9FABA
MNPNNGKKDKEGDGGGDGTVHGMQREKTTYRRSLDCWLLKKSFNELVRESWQQGPPGHIAFHLVCHASTFSGLIGSSDSIVSQLRRDTGCKIHCEDSVAATETASSLSSAPSHRTAPSNSSMATSTAVNSSVVFSKLLAHTLCRLALSLAKEGEEKAVEGDDVEAARIACRSWWSPGRGERAVEIEELVTR